MKKAKIMLMAIAITGVVGGALAFKAKNFTAHTFFTLNAAKTSCNVPTQTFLTIAAPPTPTQTVYYSVATATVNNACPALRVIASE